MEEADKTLEDGTVKETTNIVSPRHREHWQNLGWAAYVLCAIFGFLLLYCYPLTERMREAMWMQPQLLWELFPKYLMLTVSVLLFCLGWAYLLKSYCFARAETTEKMKLYDYLKSEAAKPVREQFGRALLGSAGVLLVLIAVLGVYYLILSVVNIGA